MANMNSRSQFELNDDNNFETFNFRLENRTSDPPNGMLGSTYFNTEQDSIRIKGGDGWSPISTDPINSCLDLSPASPLLANATGYSLTFTPDPPGTGNNKGNVHTIRVASDVASAASGVWAEFFVQGSWVRCGTQSTLAAENSVAPYNLFGPIPFPLRINVTNGTSPQSRFEATFFRTESKGPSKILDLQIGSSIPANTTVYSREFDSSVDGVSPATLWIKADTAITTWREVKIGNNWRRDAINPTIVSLSTPNIFIPTSYGNSPFSLLHRWAVRNSTAGVSTVSHAFITARGVGFI